jgi:hypothetical protein
MEDNFVAKSLGEPLRRSPLFRARKLPITDFSGHSGAESGVAPDYTPEGVQHHCSAQSIAQSNSGFHSGFAKQQKHSYKKHDIFCS